MLGFWQPHKDYQDFVVHELSSLARVNPSALFEYETEISKLYILDLDPLKGILAPLYSITGRPSKNQPQLFRSFILMNHMHYTLDKWLIKLQNNFVLRTICGFTFDTLPSLASYYDLINRIIKLDERPRHKAKKRKPKKKVGKGVKLPPKRPGIVARLASKIIGGRRLNFRPEIVLQKIFADVCVKRSLELGLLNQTLSVSGDGTCIKTGASSYGVKTCDCNSIGNYHCDCNRKFSDPNATWGWDSHKEQWFYGYTGYFISTYNKNLKLDLPLYLRLVDAKRHDSISAVVAIAEFRDLYPFLTVDTFLSDSASDNYATYELLEHFNINAVIALNSINRGNFKYPKNTAVDENGTPICISGNKMIYNGYCVNRHRLKWRCPRFTKKANLCNECQGCSKSSYGRVKYTKPKWDLRLFTKIPRGSEEWKQKMKERTAAERVNNRVLNNYGIENSKQRGKKRISFLTTIAGFNIHLDAQLAKLKADRLFDFKT
ncbi:MAG: transposase, partial [archaeon]